MIKFTSSSPPRGPLTHESGRGAGGGTQIAKEKTRGRDWEQQSVRYFRAFHHLDSKASQRYRGGGRGRGGEEVGSASQVGPAFSLTPITARS